MTLPLIIAHGISQGEDPEVEGFSNPLLAAMLEVALEARVKVFSPQIREFLWASEATAVERQVTEQVSAVSTTLRKLSTLDAIVDYASDIFSYALLKQKLVARMLMMAAEHGGQCVLAGHSMGSILVIDSLIEAMQRFGKPPCAAVCTFGSPGGISIPFAGQIGYLDRPAALERLPKLGIPWINLYDVQDVVVSGHLGSVVGLPFEQHEGYRKHGVVDIEVDTGWYHNSHVSYWENEIVASTLFDLVNK